MVDTMIDIYHGHRGKFNRCKYFTRNEDEEVGDLSQWVLNKSPKGIFFAKPVTTETNQADNMGNVLMYDVNQIMIETTDETPELTRGCIVTFRGKVWITANVQRSPHIKETEFSQEDHCTTIISLRR